jgi:hypothetical protein
MRKDEQEKFNEFIEEIKKYEFLDQASALVILNRFTRGFSYGKIFRNTQAKLKYFSYWFKVACKKGILENRGLGYKILKHD